MPTSTRYNCSKAMNDHFSHVVVQYMVNDRKFAYEFYFCVGGSFAHMGLGQILPR